MLYVKVGYYGDSCEVCSKSSTALPGDEPMFHIRADQDGDHRMIFVHMACLMKHLNEAREKVDLQPYDLQP